MYPKRQLEKIIDTIGNEQNIKIKHLCNNWIILLQKNNIIKQIFGYNFDLNTCMTKMNCDDKYACSSLLNYNNIPTINYDFYPIEAYKNFNDLYVKVKKI